jgi:hypothetical protein
MVVGDKALPPDTPASDDGTTQRALALVLLVLCGAGAAWVMSLGG